MLSGIDVSHWQGNINFKKVKATGIDFVIIKAGGSDDGFYKDSQFENNYSGAKAAGLHVGAYYFVGRKFTSAEDGVADANRFYEIIKGKQFDMPVYVDVEATSPNDKAGATEATVAFCKHMEDLGYYAGVYASAISGFRDRLDADQLKMFTLWVAQYSDRAPTYPSAYGIWQYYNSGLIDGINGNVDLDFCYGEYPDTIIKYGMNGYSTEHTKTNEDLAREVIAGVWGNGNYRKIALENAGYDYNKIQEIVNEMLEK